MKKVLLLSFVIVLLALSQTNSKVAVGNSMQAAQKIFLQLSADTQWESIKGNSPTEVKNLLTVLSLNLKLNDYEKIY